MANNSAAIHIPLDPAEAIRLAMKVKPTAEMPRPGANPTKKKRKAARRQALSVTVFFENRRGVRRIGYYGMP